MDRPPAVFWLGAAAVAVLRMLPYLYVRLVETPPGIVLLPLGYLPKDLLQYLALMRQLSEDGAWIWANPFTTEHQSPRIILPFFWLPALLAGVSGAAPGLVLELLRVPLVLCFFRVLWAFLRPIAPSAPERLAACALIGFSGGLEGLAVPVVRLLTDAGTLPPLVGSAVAQDTWHLFGWSTFAAFYNPLWVAALTVALLVLRPLLDPTGPRRPAELARLGGLFLLLYWIHPYSGVVVLAVAGSVGLVEAIFAGRVDWARHARTALAIGPAVLVSAAVGRWQAGDGVYRASAGGVFGGQALSVFWYPVTLGALVVLVLRGARHWSREGRPHGPAVLAWIGAVILLHSSPVLNGYHFVFHLHVPVCIVAAPALCAAVRSLRAGPAPRRLGSGILLVATFASFLYVTREAFADVWRYNRIPASYAAVVDTLARRPPGNAFVPPALGNVLPAYTPHRVWAGHWFLTPRYGQRVAVYEELVSDPGRTADLRALLAEQRMRYVVVEDEHAEAVATARADRIGERLPHHDLTLFVLR
jgi:hypothetical protein